MALKLADYSASSFLDPQGVLRRCAAGKWHRAGHGGGRAGGPTALPEVRHRGLPVLVAADGPHRAQAAGRQEDLVAAGGEGERSQRVDARGSEQSLHGFRDGRVGPSRQGFATAASAGLGGQPCLLEGPYHRLACAPNNPSDAAWRQKIGPDQIGWTHDGIPFKSPKQGKNIAVVTRAGGFPAKIEVPVDAGGKELYLMLSGMTFPVQSHVVNLRVTLEYADGTRAARRPRQSLRHRRLLGHLVRAVSRHGGQRF